MIKNFFIILTLCFLIFACGKKSDPVFNEKENNSKININQASRSV
tara:strand:- start:254 stop:388 length:135 start_codon:yes stop_codon:yes gene_type:complete